jgi:hypothetical protein
MPAYLFQAPNGVAGDITRTDVTNVEPAMLKAVSSVFAQAFGIPMAYVTGGISQWQGSNVAADFAGVLVREVPSIAGSTDQTFPLAVPNPVQPQGLAVRGYVSVLCKVGTPVRGGVVYIRTVASGAKLIGDFEATSDPGNNVALSATQAEWATDGKDADNNAELRIAR